MASLHLVYSSLQSRADKGRLRAVRVKNRPTIIHIHLRIYTVAASLGLFVAGRTLQLANQPHRINGFGAGLADNPAGCASIIEAERSRE